MTLQLREHALVPGHTKVSLIALSAARAGGRGQRAVGWEQRAGAESSRQEPYDPKDTKTKSPEISPENIKKKSEKGMERQGKAQEKVSTETVEAQKEVADTATSVQEQASSIVTNVIFFVGVFLILCCCMCCLFYFPRKGEQSSNPLVEVIREDRLKLQAQQSKYLSDVIHSIQFQAWSDSFFDRDKYMRNLNERDGTADLRELLVVLVEVYGAEVEKHWIYVRVRDANGPERITCDDFLEIMMFFECKQYTDKHYFSPIPGLVINDRGAAGSDNI